MNYPIQLSHLILHSWEKEHVGGMGKSFFENKKSTTLTITFWNYAMFQYRFAPPELKWNLVSGRKLFIGIGSRVPEQFNA